MTELMALIVGMVGKQISVDALFKLLPTLIPVVADLSDGDARLSAENRLKVQSAIQDLKDGDLL